MRTLAATEKNDLALNAGGAMSIISGIDAIAQTARQYMQARAGEMFLAMTDGMPFDPVVWSGTPNIAQFEAAGRIRLLQVPGIIEVLSFTARLEDNVLAYIASIRTDQGEVAING